MFAVGLLALASTSMPSLCLVERAVYRLRGSAGVTAGFTGQRFQTNYASNLFFWIRTPDKRKWWFSMNTPNGFAGISLSPDVDANKITKADHEAEEPPQTKDAIQVDFDMFDRNYNVIATTPQRGIRAPAHLYARGIGPLIWYNPIGAANGDKTAKVVPVPIAMYDLTGCRNQ